MSAIIIVFPAWGMPHRAAIEAVITWMIDWLDAEDLVTTDCEPDVEEESDDGEIESWQEWHTRSNVCEQPTRPRRCAERPLRSTREGGVLRQRA